MGVESHQLSARFGQGIQFVDVCRVSGACQTADDHLELVQESGKMLVAQTPVKNVGIEIAVGGQCFA